MAELAHRDVHRHPEVVVPERSEPPLREARALEHEGADGDDETRALGDRDEAIGGDAATRGMRPADQGLGAEDASRPHVDLRLVHEVELLGLHRRTERVQERDALLDVDRHLSREVAVVAAALILRAIERYVRLLQRVRAVAVGLGEAHETEGRAHVRVDPVDLEGLRDRLGDGGGGDDALGPDDAEDVARDACHRGRVAERVAEAVRHLAQQRVAEAMTERVVDLREEVEVDEREHRIGALLRVEDLVETDDEAGAVRDVAERIDERGRAELPDEEDVVEGDGKARTEEIDEPPRDLVEGPCPIGEDDERLARAREQGHGREALAVDRMTRVEGLVDDLEGPRIHLRIEGPILRGLVAAARREGLVDLSPFVEDARRREPLVAPTEQLREPRQHDLRELLRPREPEHVGRRAHDEAEAPAVLVEHADLLVGAHGRHERREETRLRQLGLRLVVVDVVVADRLELGGVAGLPGAEDDARVT